MTSLCVVVLHVSCVYVYVCCKPYCCGRQHHNVQRCVDVVCCGAQMAMDMRRCVCVCGCVDGGVYMHGVVVCEAARAAWTLTVFCRCMALLADGWDGI